MRRILVVAVVMALAFTVSCKSRQKGPTDESKQDSGKEIEMTEEKKFTEPTAIAVDAGKKYTAVIKTSKGDIVCELFAMDAPLSVTNFKQLAEGGYYDGLTFHRVEPGFVIQGGDPTGTGTGGPGYTIPAEIKRKHDVGALAWARTGDEVNPERRSSGSQFYITLGPTPFLDGAYTVFGQTVAGMDIAGSIEPGDRIESVTISAE